MTPPTADPTPPWLSPPERPSRPPRPSRHAAALAALDGLAFTGDRMPELAGDWGAHFAERMGARFSGRLVLEIGCFDAEFLCRMAALEPSTGFIGLDWKAGAIVQGAQRATREGLRNVALIHGRAQDVHKLFGKMELDDIWVFHPDPCDKPKELPNRLVNGAFLLQLHALLRGRGSTVAIKTDHPGYYQWVLAVLGLAQPEWFSPLAPDALKTAPKTRRRDLVPPDELPPPDPRLLQNFQVSVNSADFWNDPAAQTAVAKRSFAGQVTLFESRFLKKRQPIYFIELQLSVPR